MIQFSGLFVFRAFALLNGCGFESNSEGIKLSLSVYLINISLASLATYNIS